MNKIEEEGEITSASTFFVQNTVPTLTHGTESHHLALPYFPAHNLLNKTHQMQIIKYFISISIYIYTYRGGGGESWEKQTSTDVVDRFRLTIHSITDFRVFSQSSNNKMDKQLSPGPGPGPHPFYSIQLGEAIANPVYDMLHGRPNAT